MRDVVGDDPSALRNRQPAESCAASAPAVFLIIPIAGIPSANHQLRKSTTFMAQLKPESLTAGSPAAGEALQR